MNYLDSEQLFALARTWKIAAFSLNQYQGRCWNELSLEQHLDLNAYQNSLLNRALDLESGLTKIGFEDNTHALQTISLVTFEAQKAMQTMNVPSVGLNIGAVLVALAAATARSKVKAIQNALRELEDLAGFKP